MEKSKYHPTRNFFFLTAFNSDRMSYSGPREWECSQMVLLDCTPNVLYYQHSGNLCLLMQLGTTFIAAATTLFEALSTAGNCKPRQNPMEVQGHSG